MSETTNAACDLVVDTASDVGILRDRLKRFCIKCKDPKDLCEVCTVRAMIYHLRFFELTFGYGESREI